MIGKSELEATRAWGRQDDTDQTWWETACTGQALGTPAEWGCLSLTRLSTSLEEGHLPDSRQGPPHPAAADLSCPTDIYLGVSPSSDLKDQPASQPIPTSYSAKTGGLPRCQKAQVGVNSSHLLPHLPALVSANKCQSEGQQDSGESVPWNRPHVPQSR